MRVIIQLDRIYLVVGATGKVVRKLQYSCVCFPRFLLFYVGARTCILPNWVDFFVSVPHHTRTVGKDAARTDRMYVSPHTVHVQYLGLVMTRVFGRAHHANTADCTVLLHCARDS